MAIGTVKFFNHQRGFGFIEPTDGTKDVFVHISAVQRAGMEELVEGQKISFDVVEERDVKGLYKKARSGEIPEFTGVSDPYEAPENPEITIKTENETPEESAQQIVSYLEERDLIPAG